jgi:hypothetical protein
MSPLLKRWLAATLAIFVIIFGIIFAFRVKEDYEYASGNEYARTHMSERINYSMNRSFRASLALTATVGQAFFWAIEGFQQHKRKTSPDKEPISPIIIAIAVVVLVFFTLLLTLPLWFKIPS